jgi:hypothetical protein
MSAAALQPGRIKSRAKELDIPLVTIHAIVFRLGSRHTTVLVPRIAIIISIILISGTRTAPLPTPPFRPYIPFFLSLSLLSI